MSIPSEKTAFYDQLADALSGAPEARACVDPDVLQAFFRDRAPRAGSTPAPASRPAPQVAADAPPMRRTRFESPQPDRTAPETHEPMTAVPEVAQLDFAALREAALHCGACKLAAGRKNVVFGEGNEHAKLMFIGEGPGADEDSLGRPFVGKAGQLLDKMIAAMKFSRADVYIGNIVKCRPPGNRAPLPDETGACIGYIKRQIELIHPEVIVLLGSTPLQALMGLSGITRMRGRFLDYQGIPVMPTFHPAYLLRQESAKRDVWNDLKQVMARLGVSR